MAINVQMKSRGRDGLSEREIKKFFKKCKKQEILKEYLDKTAFARTKSQKRRDKIRENKYLRSKQKNSWKSRQKNR